MQDCVYLRGVLIPVCLNNTTDCRQPPRCMSQDKVTCLSVFANSLPLCTGCLTETRPLLQQLSLTREVISSDTRACHIIWLIGG